MKRRDPAPNQNRSEHRDHTPQTVNATVPFDFVLGPACDHETDEHQHVQRVDTRRLTARPQFEIRRDRASRQQRDDEPRLLATERREQNGFRNQGRDEREPVDLRSLRGERRQKIEQRHQRQQRRTQLIDHEDLAADEPRQQMPRIVRFHGVHLLEVDPSPGRAEQHQSGKSQTAVSSLVRIARPPDAQRADQGHQD